MTTLRNHLTRALAILAASALLSACASRPAPRATHPASTAPVSATNFLVRPTSAEKAPGAQGFLQRWLILDPIPASGVTQNAVQAAVKKEYFPNQFTVIPRDGDQVAVSSTNLTWHALDTRYYNVSLYHFGYLFDKPTDNVLFWAVTIVNCPEEMRDVRLAIGSNDASVWWVNGQEVIGIYGDRQTVVDDGVSRRLTLKKGANVIRCAIHNQGGGTDFCARFLDAEGKPITNFTLSAGDAGK